MSDLGRAKFEGQDIDQRIINLAKRGETGGQLFRDLLEARAQRDQAKQVLNQDKSMERLRRAAMEQVCISYGELAAASDVAWSKARVQMNGSRGHLERLLDLCYARKIPLLTAICVNQAGVASGELDPTALTGFIAGAERLGYSVSDSLTFHHQCREECWAWGRQQVALSRSIPQSKAVS